MWKVFARDIVRKNLPHSQENGSLASLARLWSNFWEALSSVSWLCQSCYLYYTGSNVKSSSFYPPVFTDCVDNV